MLVATACASPPEGRARWTLALLAGAIVKLTDHESLSTETVRRRLAENGLKPWRKDMWCIPQVDGEYVARMEDVLDLYAEAPDPERPVVCFDESPVQLIGEVRQPIPAEPGQLERYDYEYRRNGTVNLFVVFDPHRAWRNVKVTERRTAQDYAHCMRELVDVHYPDATCVRVVQDNLSIHTAGALYQAFAPAEARRILRRLEFHYTPKHASWLNMVEIEIGVLRGQCLDRRIDDPIRLRHEIDAWERQRNEARARIKWMFTTEKARTKMGRAYPRTRPKSHNHCGEVLGCRRSRPARPVAARQDRRERGGSARFGNDPQRGPERLLRGADRVVATRTTRPTCRCAIRNVCRPAPAAQSKMAAMPPGLGVDQRAGRRCLDSERRPPLRPDDVDAARIPRRDAADQAPPPTAAQASVSSLGACSSQFPCR